MAIESSPSKTSRVLEKSTERSKTTNSISPMKLRRKMTVRRPRHSFHPNLSAYKHYLDKIIWLFIHAVALFGTIFMMYYITCNFSRSPIAITPELKKYPVQHADFPGVAICNVNRISYKAAVELAEELLEFQSTVYNGNLTLQQLMAMLSSLGNLYTFKETEDDIGSVKILHTILERGYSGYDVNRIMKRLTPKCSNMLQRCSWGGRDQTCDDIFFLRRTQDGYCCTFNYARRNDGFGSSQIEVFASQSVEHTKNIGLEYGLSVILNPEVEDNVYKLLPGHGFKILIFPSYNYPDQFNGGVQESHAAPNTEVFLNLNAMILYSKPEVIQYDVVTRDCLFNAEQSTIFQGYYSFNDCIMHCRLQSILKLCKCTPFFHPFLEDAASSKVCNLKDLLCLTRHKNEWINFKPRCEDSMVPFECKNFSGKYLECDCFPSCENIAYFVSVNSIPLTASSIIWDRGTRFTIRNHTIIHINFRNAGVIRLRQDILYYWYELMGNYGGICGLFLGVSVINVLEMLYISIWRPFKSNRRQPSKVNKTDKIRNIPVTVVQHNRLAVQSLYWHEVAGYVANKPFELLHGHQNK